jgi:DNA-binding transcriptional MerR regulator
VATLVVALSIEEKGGTRVLEGFTVPQTVRLTGCTSHQLRYWDQVNLLRPSIQRSDGRQGKARLYSFRDLVALKVVRSLLDGGMSLQQVRRAYSFLRRQAGLERHLSEVKLVTDGRSIFEVCRTDGETLDALRQGQMAFCVAIDAIARSIDDNVTEFLRDRDAFLDILRSVEVEPAAAQESAQA